MARYRNITLGSAKNADIGVGSLNGFVNRSFRLPNIGIDDSYVGSRMGLALGVHVERDVVECVGPYSALVEVKYCILENNSSRPPHPTWTNIPADVWSKFFDLYPKDDGTADAFNCHKWCRMLENGMTTLPDGETPCFKLVLGDEEGSSIAKRLGASPLVKFIYEWQVKFPIFVKYWDRISTARELNDIAAALDKICNVAYSVKYNKYGGQKKEVIEAIGGYEILLAKKEALLSQVFEEAADAMNQLSEEFGIEIDIDDHCRSKES